MTSVPTISSDRSDWRSKQKKAKNLPMKHEEKIFGSGSKFTETDTHAICALYSRYGSLRRFVKNHGEMVNQEILSLAGARLDNLFSQLSHVLGSSNEFLELDRATRDASGIWGSAAECMFSIVNRFHEERGYRSNAYHNSPYHKTRSTGGPRPDLESPTKLRKRAMEQSIEQKMSFMKFQETSDDSESESSDADSISVASTSHDGAVYSHKQESFQAGDEATVNTALVLLVLPLASIDDVIGRVKFDRKNYVVSHGERDFYTAKVDGVVLGQFNGRADYFRTIAFFEAKGNLQAAKNGTARRQVCSEMAAIIHNEDDKDLGRVFLGSDDDTDEELRLPYFLCPDRQTR
ncbi:uncharacterized protein KY384_004691 [Bacidia gigantensis]|uniref:uncharacterized protein n=1 Tax=Bacidia gigantensis TaxID=2732470 RepID=UPI001D050609|nr:uncharacterized protein KY384_004691 [Bacidia gigantensis]KAG8530191.1 hypothetical protein KY384_004691 [Bacidia gigantensis]